MSPQLSPPVARSRVGLLEPDGPFGRFAVQLLERELPALPPERRRETVAFVCRRARQVPSPLRLGISAVTVGVALALRTVGPERTTAALRATSLPFVGELPRMVRSLGFAYVWETWPDTGPTGSPA